MIIKCLPCLSLQKEGDCGQLKVFCPGNEVGTSSPCWCSKLGWQKLPLRHKPCPCPPAAGQVCRPCWAAQRPAPAPQPGCGCCSQLAPRGTKFNLSAISPANRPKINFDMKIRLQGKVQGRNKKKKNNYRKRNTYVRSESSGLRPGEIWHRTLKELLCFHVGKLCLFVENKKASKN